MDTKTPDTSVPASEFVRNFGRYRMQAQRRAVAVTSHGEITGYFIAPQDYLEYERMKATRRSFATVELSDEKVQAIAKSRMHPSHKHLDALLKAK
ncbi:MAG: type II toxin-antitoxin system Phd/YefM family antitoxin [Methyloceanibacter sp.]